MEFSRNLLSGVRGKNAREVFHQRLPSAKWLGQPLSEPGAGNPLALWEPAETWLGCPRSGARRRSQVESPGEGLRGTGGGAE